MWSKFLEVKNGYTAEIWREFLHHEGVAVQIEPPLEIAPMTVPRVLWVPDSKTHVADELLRKI